MEILIRRLDFAPAWYLSLRHGDPKMPDETPFSSINRELTSRIVAAYVRRSQIASDQLATLISTVHEVITSLGKPARESEVERSPAVPIRRSVHRDYVVCLDCGWRGQMLRRHVATGHGLSVEQYRARWSLRPDHPITAPRYSERRSTMAKQLGLGRNRGASIETMAVPEMETQTAPKTATPRRRPGRPRTPRS
jgi:predicted transcriptional regulator